MLPRVLLHVIEPAIPVDVAAHAAVLLQLAIDHMRDVAVLVIEHVEHSGLVDGAGIERLAAGRGVERRAIEDELPPVVLARDLAHDGVEFDQIGVRVIETFFSHGSGTTDRARPLRRSPWRAARSCRTRRRGARQATGRSSCA